MTGLNFFELSLDSDDSDVSVASSEDKEVMIKIEPEDDYDELPEIQHSTVSGSSSSFAPSLAVVESHKKHSC